MPNTPVQLLTRSSTTGGFPRRPHNPRQYSFASIISDASFASSLLKGGTNRISPAAIFFHDADNRDYQDYQNYGNCDANNGISIEKSKQKSKSKLFYIGDDNGDGDDEDDEEAEDDDETYSPSDNDHGQSNSYLVEPGGVRPNFGLCPSAATFPDQAQLNSLLSNIKTVEFDFRLCIDRIRVSWRETDHTSNARSEQYQLRAYLLLDDDVEDEIDCPQHIDSGCNSDEYFDDATMTCVEESAKTAKSSHKSSGANQSQPHHHHSHHHHHHHHRKRKTDQKPLYKQPIVATRIVSLSNKIGFIEICFDGAEIKFRTKIPVVPRSKRHGSGYVFRSRVVRLKLERVKCGSSDRVTIGFVDVDLAHYRHQYKPEPAPRPDGYVHLPMVLFADYDRHLVRHHLSPDLFCFDIGLRLDSTPVADRRTRFASAPADDVSKAPSIGTPDGALWTSVGSLTSYYHHHNHHCNAENGGGAENGGSSPSPDAAMFASHSATCPSSLHLLQMLLRRDSLPNLSKDKDLKYHETPATSLTKHFLNFFGILPPGKLFRVSIHFGQIEHLDRHLAEASGPSSSSSAPATYSNSSFNSNCSQNSNDSSSAISSGSSDHSSPPSTPPPTGSICACFEVKHHQHQPTIFHHHHQRHSICCRTKQLAAGTPTDQFDQHFTFFERFYYQDSPETCLSIRNGAGKRLYKYKCHLADYVHCRSVNQYFSLQNKKTGKYCRLQFSIVVKPIFGPTSAY